MPTHSYRPTRALAAAGLALALGLSACGQEDDASSGHDAAGHGEAGAAAADAAVTWLESQLTDGLLVNEEFGTPDHGGTVDAVYALRHVGGHDEVAETMAAAVLADAREYVAPGSDVWAGNAGKAVALAAEVGADPADLDGFDALAALEDRTLEDGRTSDKSGYGDFANTFGQIWAVKGLAAAGSEEAEKATEFLLLQQCEAGFFRQDFTKAGTADQSCDAAKGQASHDATALAVIALHDLAEEDEALRTALDAAVAYLADEQAEDGSLTGSTQLPANANSTGLAGWALQVADEHDAAEAAAAWVRAHQLGECPGALAEHAGAIAYDDQALAAAGAKGITKKTSYQWRLATAQALPALVAAPEGAAEAPCPTS